MSFIRYLNSLALERASRVDKSSLLIVGLASGTRITGVLTDGDTRRKGEGVSVADLSYWQRMSSGETWRLVCWAVGLFVNGYI